MGWRFPYASVIRSKADVFDPGVELLTPESNSAVVEAARNGSGTGARAIAPGQALQFGFLGTKGTGGVPPAVVDDVLAPPLHAAPMTSQVQRAPVEITRLRAGLAPLLSLTLQAPSPPSTPTTSAPSPA